MLLPALCHEILVVFDFFYWKDVFIRPKFDAPLLFTNFPQQKPRGQLIYYVNSIEFAGDIVRVLRIILQPRERVEASLLEKLDLFFWQGH